MESAVENLSVISEFSIGMAGFAGIVAVFVGTNRGWNRLSKFRAGNLIILSFFAGFSALISLGLSPYIVGEALWQASCAVQALFAILFITFNHSKSVAAFGLSIFSMEHPVNLALWLTYSGNLILQLMGATGTFGEFAFGVFYGGLVLHLGMAALNFYRLIFSPSSDPDDT